ncbi:MAG TPA: transposase [Telluria sp.]|nr:transposase [Telluria sp.]
MPRQARYLLPGVPVHVTQRGANRQNCFLAEGDFRLYWQLLADVSRSTACRIHAYVFMTNHVHLLLTSPTVDALGVMMKRVNQPYAQYFNRVYTRTGPLWEGRFRAHIVQDDTYLLTCQRYIELNPVRAGMCEGPADYLWSSHRCNAFGLPDDLVLPHPTYTALAADATERRGHYRGLFHVPVEQDQLEAIRNASRSGGVYGSVQFAAGIARGRRPTA